MSSSNHLIECADSCCFPVLYSSHTAENTASPGILIAPFVVRFSFLVLISIMFWAALVHHLPVGMQYFYMKKLQPYTIAAAHMNRAAKYPAPALHCSAEPGCWYLHSCSPQPKVQPLCFWFPATSTAAANPCRATGISEESSSPFFSGAEAPPVLSTDHKLPKLRPPFASVLQQQFFAAAVSPHFMSFVPIA